MTEVLTTSLDERVAQLTASAFAGFLDELGTEYRQYANLFEYGEMAPEIWLLSEASANTLPDTHENVKAVKAGLEKLCRSMFVPSIYGELDLLEYVSLASKIQGFDETPFGRAWWLAVVWAFTDDLIPLREAAEISNTKIPNVSQNARLVYFINPESNQRQDRRLVLRSQVLEIWADRIAEMG